MLSALQANSKLQSFLRPQLVVDFVDFLLQRALMAYMGGVAIRAPMHDPLKRSILMLQFSAMVALDLSMAKFHHWRTPKPYPEDSSTSDEVFHTPEVEILHRPTPIMPSSIYNAERATLQTLKSIKPEEPKSPMQARSFAQICASAYSSARRD